MLSVGKQSQMSLMYRGQHFLNESTTATEIIVCGGTVLPLPIIIIILITIIARHHYSKIRWRYHLMKTVHDKSIVQCIDQENKCVATNEDKPKSRTDNETEAKWDWQAQDPLVLHIRSADWWIDTNVTTRHSQMLKNLSRIIYFRKGFFFFARPSS